MPKKIDAVSRKWIRNKSDELAVKNGCWFDPKRGSFVADWIEEYCFLCEGFDVPTPVRLMPWTRDLIMRVYSWIRYSKDYKMDVRRFRKASAWVPKKNSKQLALATPIPTPCGWKTIGELKLGDIVFSEDGMQTKIVHLHPINNLPCERVRFSNGESIDCDSNHLWKTSALQESTNGICPKKGNQYKPRINKFSPIAVRTTQQIKETLIRADGARNHSVMLPKPINTASIVLPIDPYFLGYWLGNGDSSGARVTTNIKDWEFFESKFKELGFDFSISLKPSKGQARFGFHNILRTLKTYGMIQNKHVPVEYFRSSIDQRLSLLRGLMDSDGTISRCGKDISFCSKSDRLKDAVCELLSSLGIKHNAYLKRCEIKSIGFSDLYWNVQFATHSDGVVPFCLPRKIERLNKEFKQMKARSRTVQITSIESLDPIDMRCITVDHPSGMFLCGKTMIPTHNSPTLAFNGLYLAFGEKGQGRKCFSVAGDKEQAMISHRHAMQIVEASPKLKEICKVNKTTGRIVCESTSSFYGVISSGNEEGQHGLNANGMMIDECHVISTSLMAVLEGASISKPEPLQFEVSTAGNNPDCYGKRQFDYGQRVAAGDELDQQFFHLEYSLSETVSDAELDRKIITYAKQTNPAWGITIFEEEFLASYNRAKRSPATFNDFKQLRLNQWQQTSSPFIPTAAWQACAEQK